MGFKSLLKFYGAEIRTADLRSSVLPHFKFRRIIIHLTNSSAIFGQVNPTLAISFISMGKMHDRISKVF